MTSAPAALGARGAGRAPGEEDARVERADVAEGARRPRQEQDEDAEREREGKKRKSRAAHGPSRQRSPPAGLIAQPAGERASERPLEAEARDRDRTDLFRLAARRQRRARDADRLLHQEALNISAVSANERPSCFTHRFSRRRSTRWNAGVRAFGRRSELIVE